MFLYQALWYSIFCKSKDGLKVNMSQVIRFPKVGIEINLDIKDGFFYGIREVKWRDTPLRSADEPIFPMISTADGWMLDRLEYIETKEISGGAVIIRTVPHFRQAPSMAFSDSASKPRINTSSWSQPVVGEGARLDWVIRAAVDTIDGVQYEGFSYGFRYVAKDFRVFQIEDRATWELGGDAAGNTFLMRNFFGPPIQRLTRESAYDSGWTVPGISNPFLFQHLPLYDQLQGFTFQYDASAVLLTVHEQPSHVRSFFHKEAGDHKLLHFNQFCFDLTDTVITPERQILAAYRPPGGETAVHNHFLALRQFVQGRLRTHAGILRFDIPRPSAHVETWEIAKLGNLPAIWKKLYDWHIHRAYLMPLWRSNETDVAPRFGADRNQFNFIGNMCCPIELEIADCYGGWDGLKQAMAKAIELEIDAYMWCGSHFSSLSPLEKMIPDLFARDAAGQCDRNQYGHVLFAVNQRNKAYQQYLFEKFKRLKECGISGVYRDSHFNMASDTLHYQHDAKGSSIYSMHEAELAIQRHFQETLGFLYYVDAGGIFGTPMAGTAYDYIHGQEMMYQDIETSDLDPAQVKGHGLEPINAYHRGLSCRLLYQVGVDVNRYPDKSAFSDWWDPKTFVPLLEGYARVEPYMGTMQMLEDEAGTRWRDTLGHEVVFPWKDVPVDSMGEGGPFSDVVSVKRHPSSEPLKAGRIYFREKKKGFFGR
jgi:hypothetical protein